LKSAAQAKWLEDFHWVAQPWTGNDAPYRKIKDDIDRDTKAGISLNALALKYKALAMRASRDPRAQFRWVYAAYRAATKPNESNTEAGAVLDRAAPMLAGADSPHCYEYDRLRFLVFAHAGVGYQIAPMGNRLLEKAPRDESIAYEYISCLNVSPNTQDRQRASFLAQQYAKEYPSLRGYSLLGQIYYYSWRKHNQKQDADNAFRVYQAYLDHSPTDDPFRTTAQRLMENIRGGQTMDHGIYVLRSMLP
jgi:hypothetical protein